MLTEKTVHDWNDVIANALGQLCHAIFELENATRLSVPMPRIRKFHLGDGIYWPCGVDSFSLWKIGKEYSGNFYFSLSGRDARIARSIVEKLTQPTKILRALRCIQAATAWCLARAEGRKRQEEEILRQQAKAIEALQAEKALLILAK